MKKKWLNYPVYLTLIILTFSFFYFLTTKKINIPKIERSDQSEIVYSFEPRFDNQGNTYLVIQMSFRGVNNKHGSYVIFPDHWAGQEKLYNEIRNIKLLRPNQSIEKAKQDGKYINNIYLIHHKPNDIITVEYELYQSWHEPITRHNYHRPIFQKDYFLFIGYNGLAMPAFSIKDKIKISFIWKNIPKNWIFADSFGFNQKLQTINKVGSVADIDLAVYVARKYKVSHFKIKDNLVYFISKGNWKFKTDKLVVLLKKIIKAERDFWSDYNFPYFLVPMIPVSPKKGTSKGGTGLNNSFILYISENIKGNVNDEFAHLLAHELFHIWNGGKIRTGRFATWLREGFTDYYANILNFRAGIITAKTFLATINQNIKRYYVSPFRNLDVKTAVKMYWKAEEIHKQPYLQGFILGYNWNAKIKESSNGKYSLDNFMYDLLKISEKGNFVARNDNIVKLMAKYLNIKQDIENNIIQGKTITIYKNALGPCFDLQEKQTKILDLGFNYKKAILEGIVLGLKKDSNAYKAGLRNGQKITGYDIYFGKINTKVGIRIKNDKGKEVWIRYFPIGKQTVKFPVFVLKQDKDLNACLKSYFSSAM